MGGAVSAGEDNDALVEHLVDGNYIRSPELAVIFRAVDRGHYYLKSHRDSAYIDVAWKFNNLHLSAACIYSEAMENLDLQPGMSFLNLGSGLGYLSTMAGLILGSCGINHGIEVYEDVVEYAQERVNEFVLKCPQFDRFEFCHPSFEVGNCLLLPPDTPRYDRIYCGAACPSEYAGFIMNLLTVGGKLVFPLDDQLQVKIRTGENEWNGTTTLPVSFAQLVIPDKQNSETMHIPERNALRLQELCRFCIRRVIRKHYILQPDSRRTDKVTELQTSKTSLRRRRFNTETEGGPHSSRRRKNTSGESDNIFKQNIGDCDKSTSCSTLENPNSNDAVKTSGTSQYQCSENDYDGEAQLLVHRRGCEHINHQSTEERLPDRQVSSDQCRNAAEREINDCSHPPVPFFRAQETVLPTESRRQDILPHDCKSEEDSDDEDESDTEIQEEIHDDEDESDTEIQEEIHGDDDEGDTESQKEVFAPLIETPFTFAIRELPLPSSLLSYLLYYRQ